MNKMIKLLLACAPVLFIAACGGGDDDLDDRLDVADPNVRLVHAVPLAPNVSLFRNDVAQASDVTNVPYKGASNYFDVSVAEDTWAVKTTVGNVTVGTATFAAARGNRYTLVAIPGANATTELINIRDPYNKSLTTDKGRIRVLNAAFNQADIDVYLTEPNTDIAAQTPAFPSVDFRASSPATGNDSIEVTAGNHVYWLVITAAGSKTPLFRAPVTVGDNADWLVTVLPDTVLVVAANSSTPATELDNDL
jgi:hypothetical protein